MLNESQINEENAQLEQEIEKKLENEGASPEVAKELAKELVEGDEEEGSESDC